MVAFSVGGMVAFSAARRCTLYERQQLQVLVWFFQGQIN
jgi:hypothetical protein